MGLHTARQPCNDLGALLLASSSLYKGAREHRGVRARGLVVVGGVVLLGSHEARARDAAPTRTAPLTRQGTACGAGTFLMLIDWDRIKASAVQDRS